MNAEIDELIRTPFAVAPLSREVVVYGAGNCGRAVSAYLGKTGHRVVAFLDAAAVSGQRLDGIPVHRPAEWPGRWPAGELDVVVAVHNYAVDMVLLIAQVRGLGFRRVLNMVDFHNHFPDGQPYRFWLTARIFYRGREREIEAAMALLGDATSRRWFSDVLAFRLSGDYSRLPAPCTADQYFPASLPRWSNPIRFIDCGAFDGDTVEALARAGYGFDAIAAFEPDPANFVALAARVRRHGAASCFPCGVADSTRIVRFASGAGMGSHETPDGNAVIQCVAIDEALPGFRPTLLKMDVEGAERDALEGARRTIADARPSLAIALYHRPQDLWEIPQQIAGWNLGYRLEIRGHGHGSFDTVLYALPGGG
ncbi:MAG: FkbM family methyltransferase [Betaproteobacteria bacterium]